MALAGAGFHPEQIFTGRGSLRSGPFRFMTRASLYYRRSCQREVKPLDIGVRRIGSTRFRKSRGHPATSLSRATINTKARLVTLTNTMPRNIIACSDNHRVLRWFKRISPRMMEAMSGEIVSDRVVVRSQLLAQNASSLMWQFLCGATGRALGIHS